MPTLLSLLGLLGFVTGGRDGSASGFWGMGQNSIDERLAPTLPGLARSVAVAAGVTLLVALSALEVPQTVVSLFGRFCGHASDSALRRRVRAEADGEQTRTRIKEYRAV